MGVTRINFQNCGGASGIELEFQSENPDQGITLNVDIGCGYVYSTLNIDDVAQLREWLNEHFAWLDSVSEVA